MTIFEANWSYVHELFRPYTIVFSFISITLKNSGKVKYWVPFPNFCFYLIFLTIFFRKKKQEFPYKGPLEKSLSPFRPKHCNLFFSNRKASTEQLLNWMGVLEATSSVDCFLTLNLSTHQTVVEGVLESGVLDKFG